MIARLARDPRIQQALNAVETERILRYAVAVQQIPAPTFGEAERAEYVARQFVALGLSEVDTDEVGNVYARRPGQGQRRAVLVSAHTDTVFPRDADLTVRRERTRVHGPGIGDNALGVAALIALAEISDAAALELPGDLWLVANVAEEGLGDLRGMRRVIDRLGERVAATIVVEGMAFGHIYHAGIAVRRYCIRAEASGGHSWLDYGQPSAIHALVRLAERLTRLEVPAHPRSTLNIGRISGGTSVNTIAGHAQLELDLRSEDGHVLASMAQQVEQLIANTARECDVTLTADLCGARPPGCLAPDHPLVMLAAQALRYVGHDAPVLQGGSTDANIPLSRGLAAVTVGLTRGGNSHRPDEYIDLGPLKAGMQQLLLLVLGAYHLGASDLGALHFSCSIGPCARLSA